MPRVQRARITDDEVEERPINTQYLWRLMHYLRPYRAQVALSALVMLTASSAGLVSPMLLKIALDDYITAGRSTGSPYWRRAAGRLGDQRRVRAVESAAHGRVGPPRPGRAAG
jgi:hypothetical protein